MQKDDLAPQSPNLDSVEPAASDGPARHYRRASTTTSAIDEAVLTYQEAALLLKVSARTVERWTREGLVPYIRLPRRGRWSGVRFSRNQLLRWLRRRTVRER
jgi:excisionase family DNA binding protein